MAGGCTPRNRDPNTTGCASSASRIAGMISGGYSRSASITTTYSDSDAAMPSRIDAP